MQRSEVSVPPAASRAGARSRREVGTRLLVGQLRSSTRGFRTFGVDFLVLFPPLALLPA